MSNVKNTINEEIAGVYCDYTEDGYNEMVDFIQQAKSFTATENDRDDFIFLIKRTQDFLLTTGISPDEIDVKVNDIKDLQDFYYREVMKDSSKIGELL